MGNIEKILSDLISFKTDKTCLKNTEIVDYICSILDEHNLSYVRLMNKQTGLESIVAGINISLQDSTPTLMLSGHMDTIVTNEDQWKITKPNTPLIQDSKIYGLGAADMKSALAVYLGSIEDLKKTGLGILLSFTNDKEREMASIKDVLGFLKRKNIKPKYAFLGEPTDLHIATQSMGYMGFHTMIKGPSGQSTSKQKATPIYVGGQIILFIERLNIAFKKLATFFHVGVAKGGERKNSLPTSFELEWEMRFVHKGPAGVAIRHVINLHQEIFSENEMDISVKMIERIPSFTEGRHTEIVKTLGKILNDKSIYRLTYATEAGYMQGYGIKTVIFGPGKEELALNADEYVEIKNLYRYQDVILEFLKKQKLKQN